MNQQAVDNLMNEHPPTCEYGYPNSQLSKLFDSMNKHEFVNRAKFIEFMRGQTFTMCPHEHDGELNQAIFYVRDVHNFLRSL